MIGPTIGPSLFFLFCPDVLKNQCMISATMSAKSPWNTYTVLGIFNPRPIFNAKMTIVSPFPLHTMLNRWPKPLAIWRDIISPNNIVLWGKGFCFMGQGVHLQYESQEVFQDFWQTLYNHLNKNKHLYEFNLVFELCTQLRRPY